jgi:hypothetical protein
VLRGCLTNRATELLVARCNFFSHSCVFACVFARLQLRIHCSHNSPCTTLSAFNFASVSSVGRITCATDLEMPAAFWLEEQEQRPGARAEVRCRVTVGMVGGGLGH